MVDEVFAPPQYIQEICTAGKKRWLNDRQLAGLAEHLLHKPFLRDLTDRDWQKLARHLQKIRAGQTAPSRRPLAQQVAEDHPLAHPTPRAAIVNRAGTHLSPSAYPIVVHRLHHGMLDKAQRVYQHGGEANNFIRWSMKAISIDHDVWLVIHDLVDRIEMVDHTKNRCYVVDIETAHTSGTTYTDAKIGARYAIPLSCWRILDADGVLIQHAA